MKMYGVRLDHNDEQFLEFGTKIGLWETKSEGIRTCVKGFREIVESINHEKTRNNPGGE